MALILLLPILLLAVAIAGIALCIQLFRVSSTALASLGVLFLLLLLAYGVIDSMGGAFPLRRWLVDHYWNRLLLVLPGLLLLWAIAAMPVLHRHKRSLGWAITIVVALLLFTLVFLLIASLAAVH